MGWFSSKLTRDRGESCVDTLGKQREKHTWAWRCGSHVQKELNPALIFPNTDSPDDLSLLSFPRLSCRAFSRRVSLYSKPMWWAHVPEGLSTQRFTFSAAHIVWAETIRQGVLAREGVILPEGERDLVVGYLSVSRGFVGILCGFVISSIWELGGYSRGILGRGCGGTVLAAKWKSKNVHLICVPEQRVC